VKAIEDLLEAPPLHPFVHLEMNARFTRTALNRKYGTYKTVKAIVWP